MIRKDFYFLIVLFVFPLLFLSGTLSSSQTFFSRDLTYLFHPWRSLFAQMLQSGEMPLWNSFEMGGTPFLANCQSAVLYPFSILFSLFHFVSALKLFHLFHYALAGIGFYFLSRRLKFNSWFALIGAVLFSYNGYMITRIEFLSVLGSLIWLPWILIFCLNLDDYDKPIFYSVMVGLILSVSLFGGFPQILILQISVMAIFSLIMNPVRKVFMLWIGAWVTFVFISAVQWIPTFELLPLSIRGGSGIPFDEAASYSLPWHALLGLMDPYWLPRHPDQFSGEKFFWIWSGWWGITTTLFSIFSFFSKKNKIVLFAFSIWITGLIWSIGNHWAWYQTVYKSFFLFRLFRYPPVTLYLSVTAAAFILICGMEGVKKIILKKSILNKILVIGGLLLIIELWYYSRNISPTIPSSYYRVTSKAIETISLNQPGTVFLSPKAYLRRRLGGTTWLEAETKFRSFLFDLTNLPYKIKTIIPSGEPLALESYSQLYQKLVDFKSVDDARSLLNFWNVTHFLTRDSLGKNWNLLTTDGELKVYKNEEALGQVFGLKKFIQTSTKKELSKNLIDQKIILPIELKSSNNKIYALLESSDEFLTVFNVPFYPGWKIFRFVPTDHLSESLSPTQVLNYFCGTYLSRGAHNIYLIYCPLSWLISLSVTGGSLVILIGYGLFCITRRISNAHTIN